jgi:hypothetical protein
MAARRAALARPNEGLHSNLDRLVMASSPRQTSRSPDVASFTPMDGYAAVKAPHDAERPPVNDHWCVKLYAHVDG